ncbi:MAG: hypothetical protein ABL949_08085 [Fimbriimonadaceae bacterium]
MSFARREYELQFEPLSLAWMGDQLVDPLQYTGSDLREIPSRLSSNRISRLFDAGMVSASGVSCAFQQLGTKAVVMRRTYSPGLTATDAGVGCELERSYYYAEVTPFPIAFISWESHNDAIIFAPEYDRLRIVDLTGKVIVADSEPSEDFFHGRLEVSPSGRWLLSDGWMWHPMQARMLIDLDRVRKDPSSLNSSEILNAPSFPLFATWLSDDTLAMTPFCLPEWNQDAFNYDSFEPWTTISNSQSVANKLFIVDPESSQILRGVQLEFDPFYIACWGSDSIISPSPFPRIADLTTGQILAEFPDLQVAGFEESRFPCNIPTTTPFACHRTRPVFAHATGNKLTVIEEEA